MTRHRELPYLEILKLDRDDVGAYIKINAILNGFVK